ncbi:PepSY domain-containing protein [Ferroacidibacillus organovorans]|uniref:PepSY domain-containing protein n=1 Tax=Ferroacidibacillus organovorans TaxID=1765683 RepID=A0A1V4ER32_9BACL|nr:PepSY domain-containing protein [Ferroacidibacillus organovorans]OPG15395.1 hypothetical protein B2M26_11950 [Ferroacidibacillus organovorans]
MSKLKRWWFPTLLALIILFVCSFQFFTRPLISYQRALRIANEKVKNVASSSQVQFGEVRLAWYVNGRLFDPRRVYIVTGQDNARQFTINYVQALVDARNGKVIAIYSIDHPYQNMFSQTSVRKAEQVAENYLKPPKQ